MKVEHERIDSFVDAWLGAAGDGLFGCCDMDYRMADLWRWTVIFILFGNEEIPVCDRDAIAGFAIVESCKVEWSVK